MERKLCAWKIEGSVMVDSKPSASLSVNFLHLVVPIYISKIEKKKKVNEKWQIILNWEMIFVIYFLSILCKLPRVVTEDSACHRAGIQHTFQKWMTVSFINTRMDYF